MYFIGHPTPPTGSATTYRPERNETHIIALLDICILYLPSTITSSALLYYVAARAI